MQNSGRLAFIAITSCFLIYFVISTLSDFDEAFAQGPPRSYNRRTTIIDEVTVARSRPEDTEFTEFTNPNFTKEYIGDKAWSVLHLITGNYPERPSYDDRINIELFLKLFAELYPIQEHGNFLLKLFEENPVRAGSKKELLVYLCEIHNMVNKKLGKNHFDCSIAELKWSECGCDSH